MIINHDRLIIFLFVWVYKEYSSYICPKFQVMIFLLLTVCSFLIFVVPRNAKVYSNLLLNTVLAAYTLLLCGGVFMGAGTYTEVLPVYFWGQQIKLIIDPLSAFFIGIINFTVLTASVYAIEYMKMYRNKSATELSIHYLSFFLLHLSMILVCMIHHGVAFLVVWELMAISSFLLVMFDNEKSSVLKAGINYLIQMHVGALFLIAAFIILNLKTASFDFEALKSYFYQHQNLPLFLLFFVGFGIKAGFMPLHTWLPHAHPAAPTHVSAVMSGVMIKLGIYGILRVAMFLQTDLLAIGIIVLVVSMISGIGGVSWAIVQHDLKKLLAYHSIENIGIIGIGMGVGLIGLGLNNPVLALLGFAGAMLHVLNHSLFKSLLFYGAGAVYIKTHTRNIELLGGLIKKIPVTAVLFLIASLAICGLPPFNGFVSEFIIYKGIVSGLNEPSIAIKVLMLVAIISLVLIGGLAVFCFTKAFGVTFLGKSRHVDISGVNELSWVALAPLFLIAAAIVFIGLFPQWAVQPVNFVLASHTFNISGDANMMYALPMIQKIGVACAIFMGLAGLVWLWRFVMTLKKPLSRTETWGCAYNGTISKGQYTATSYAENFTDIAAPVVDVKTQYHALHEEDIFPESRSFETFSEDMMEKKLYGQSVDWLTRAFSRLAVIQTGNTQHYILYAFAMIFLLLMLTLFNLL